jgi:EAL domain-containing protein (putative c-di-GMP-specific phosphodiesterase class I)
MRPPALATSPNVTARLAVWAQPISHIADPLHRPVAHELLLRVRMPNGDERSAGRTVAALERSGAIADVDDWVARVAVGLLGDERLGRAHLNVSGRTIVDRATTYVERLASGLASRGVDPQRVTVELTESWPVADLAVLRRFASDVAALGCDVALDDFGAGAHAMATLAAIDVLRQVKIDGELIAACAKAERARCVVIAALAMAAAVGAETVVEAVPDLHVARWLADEGANLAQAFIFGPPAPVDLARAPGSACASVMAIGA